MNKSDVRKWKKNRKRINEIKTNRICCFYFIVNVYRGCERKISTKRLNKDNKSEEREREYKLMAEKK